MAEVLEVRASATLGDFDDVVQDLIREQLPFAMALTLTRTAQFAHRVVRKRVGRVFTIRSQRVPKGIRIQRAEKRDFPSSHATVGTVDQFIARFEFGGDQRPLGTGRFAVPSRLIRRTATGKVRVSQRPSALREKKTTFLESGPDTGAAIARRRGKRARDQRQLLYFLRPRIRIDDRLEMAKSVEQSANRRLGPEYERSMAIAIKSRRAQLGRFSSDEARFFFLKAERAINGD